MLKKIPSWLWWWYIYYKGIFFLTRGTEKISIGTIICQPNGYGVATSCLTKWLTIYLLDMVMTGIAGGTKPDKMNFGDVICCKTSWDYRAGKDIRRTIVRNI